MKQGLIVLLLLGVMACNNKKDKQAGTGTPEAMAAHIEALTETVKQNPDSVGLRLKLVDALDSAGAYTQAVAQMDSVIKNDSLNYGLWYRKAQVLEHLEDTVNALHAYRYAARIYPAPDALLAMANLYAEKKDAAAIQLCAQVAAQKLGREYSAHCDFISGIYYARTGNRTKAFAAFDRCITNDYRYMEAYMEKGFLYYDNKQFAEAAKVFETVVTVSNTYADGYYWLGKSREALNDKPGAIAGYRNAIALDASIKEAAAALKRLGE